MSYRAKNNLRLFFILGTLFLVFMWACYNLVTQQLYYHITVEQYTQDNESITEAFKKQATINRHLEKTLATEQLEAERKQDSLLNQLQKNEKLQHEKQLMQASIHLLQQKLKQEQHAKDSLSAIIRSLRRVE